MYKKGGAKYLSLWWFFVLASILVGVVAVVYFITSASINVKQTEAEILVARVSECIITNNQFNSEIFNSNFLRICGLNENILSSSGNYYLQLELYKYNDCVFGDKTEDKVSCQNPKEISFGVQNFKAQCELKKTAEAKYYPECAEKYFDVRDKDGTKLVLHIFAASNQVGKKENIK